jgi:hypothetical protein
MTKSELGLRVRAKQAQILARGSDGEFDAALFILIWRLRMSPSPTTVEKSLIR